MASFERAWLGTVPPMRTERHYGDRVVRCFVERPNNAYTLLTDAVARNPEGEAIVCGGDRLSYAEFRASVESCAAGLAAAGIGKGDRVAMLLGNGIPFPVVLFASLHLGAIAVPLSVREQTPGLSYMLAHSGAKLIVYDRALGERLPPAAATPALRHRVAIAADAADRGLPWLVDTPVPPSAPVDEDDTAIILYTSGTTGTPKGAMLTHLGICHSAMHYESCMALGAGDRALVAVPMSHVTGVIALVAAMVRVAATLIVMPTFKASAFLELAAAEGMTHSLMVPAMYNLCLLESGFDAARLSSWRLGAYGGAPMAPATIARFQERLPQLNLMNAYGSTETTSPVTMMPPSETAARSDSVGCALPCADILVMDEAGREVAAGAEGELWLAGPMVVKGYWQDAAATADNFVAGYWRSGDIGAKDRDGYVRVFDRKKDMINRGGYKVASVEVENALMSFPGVIEAAVVAAPCPVLGERVHAFVVADATLERTALKRHCRGLLADYKVPDAITVTDTPLPRNANGKLMKRDLRHDLARAAAGQAPR
ncbi:MAG TPA: class I adenylate-forming enzyme family protein [Hyphomicrobiaceae bacterium]|nr:class I adenylate-forming enzyme family protein [Hyphomicrobiaceae bacterium]